MNELDDLLISWHRWASGYTPARGFAPKSLVVGDFRISRQYDDQNGSLDHAIDERTMKAVDFEVGELNDARRAVISRHAKELSAGCCSKSTAITDARLAIAQRLRRAGVLAIADLTSIA